MYKIEAGGIREPINSIIDDDVDIKYISTWLTENLCISFASLEDLDKAINSLQKLKTDVVNRMVTRGESFVPSDYLCKGQPLVNVTAHLHEQTGDCRVSVHTFEGTDKQIDVIELSKGNGFAFQTLHLLVDASESVDLFQKIWTAVISNRVRMEKEDRNNV